MLARVLTQAAVLTAGALLFAATADARPDSRAMTCEQAQLLIARWC